MTPAEDRQAEMAVQAYIDTAKASLDQAMTRADTIQRAAAAIGTVYVGILAFVFKPERDPTQQLSFVLPVRGVWPVVFLGLAIAFTSLYLAFIRRYQLPPAGKLFVATPEAYTRWATAALAHRSWLLHMAAMSLSVGLALLPLPFLKLDTGKVLLLLLLGGVVTLTGPGIVGAVFKMVDEASITSIATSFRDDPAHARSPHGSKMG